MKWLAAGIKLRRRSRTRTGSVALMLVLIMALLVGTFGEGFPAGMLIPISSSNSLICCP